MEISFPVFLPVTGTVSLFPKDIPPASHSHIFSTLCLYVQNKRLTKSNDLPVFRKWLPVDYKPNPRFKKTCFKMEDLSFCNMQCECNVHANADRLERESGLQWSRRGVTVARVPCALGCHGLSNAVTRIPEKSGTNCEAATEGENHLWNSGGTTRIQANCIAYMGHIASRIKHLLLFMLH